MLDLGKCDTGPYTWRKVWRAARRCSSGDVCFVRRLIREIGWKWREWKGNREAQQWWDSLSPEERKKDGDP